MERGHDADDYEKEKPVKKKLKPHSCGRVHTAAFWAEVRRLIAEGAPVSKEDREHAMRKENQ